MDTNRLMSFVSSEGTLVEHGILSREVLYKGRNGRDVERFVVQAGSARTSLIFKPLTNMDTMGHEPWVYHHLAPLIPLRIPQLLAYAGEDVEAEHYWTIYEDLGALDPRFDREAIVRAVEAIPLWHQIPVDLIPPHFSGHTPKVEDVLHQLTENLEHVSAVLSKLPLPSKYIKELYELFDMLNGTFQTEMVVSHGDYYCYNIALKSNELIVLDWEYVHVNSIYWDLYNLMDITSTRYRKPHTASEVRDEALDAYIRERSESGWIHTPDSFRQGYYAYAAIYSVWILTLIDKDILSGSHDLTALSAQQEETLLILKDCVKQLV